MTEPGKTIVITAPLTETIDHAGYFIQMSMASLPIWLEGILNRKYPAWRNVDYHDDGSAKMMPAGVRLLGASLLREFPADDLVCCYPGDLHKFIGPSTRVVAVSTHNPLGVTFAAGVYTSIFGSSKQPINAHYARELFATMKANPHRGAFKVLVGGSGSWQIIQTDSYDELGVDCVVEGRSDSSDTLELFHRAIRGEELPKTVEAGHPKDRSAILIPDKRNGGDDAWVYVTDANDRYIGQLTLLALSAAPPSDPRVGDLPLIQRPRVAATLLRADALRQSSWQGHHSLPAADEVGRFIGVLRLGALARALGIDEESPPERPFTLVGSILTLWVQLLVAIVSRAGRTR